jgi:hypothetical protein
MYSFVVVCCAFLPAQAGADPPVVGRPPDWSGAVGGPFTVALHAEPTELAAEDPLTLTVRITGAGNLRDLRRPALGTLEAFQPFAVEDLDDRFVAGDPPRREFRYRLRPRSAGVPEIPRLKFVYFNPRATAGRGYQTTYSNEVPLTVKPRVAAKPVETIGEVPDWMLEIATTEEIVGAGPATWQVWAQYLLGKLGVRWDAGQHRRGTAWTAVAVALLAPPIVCGVWLVLWRRVNPGAARVARARRSRAAAVALRALEAADDDPPRRVVVAVLGYLHDRAGAPLSARTPADVYRHLADQGVAAGLLEQTVTLMRRCDAARFAPAVGESDALVEDGQKLILEWEAVS